MELHRKHATILKRCIGLERVFVITREREGEYKLKLPPPHSLIGPKVELKIPRPLHVVVTAIGIINMAPIESDQLRNSAVGLFQEVAGRQRVGLWHWTRI